MYQYVSLESNLRHPIEVPEYLEEFADFGEPKRLPKGLLSLNLETGLVKVAVSQENRVDMKFGKLLKKLEVPEAMIPDYSARMSAIVKAYNGVKLQFACTADEIEYVYENGPRSCMSASKSVRAYESPNIKLVFVEVMGRVVARSLLNCSDEDNITHTRVYGDFNLMGRLLKAEGYAEGDLDGCTLNKIEDNIGIVCPYLDCDTRINVCENYLEVSYNGEFSSQSTEGYLKRSLCENCGASISDEELVFCEEREVSLCDVCWEDTSVWVEGSMYWEQSNKIAITEGGDYFLIEEVVETSSGIYHQDDVIYCEPDDECRHKDEVVQAIVSFDRTDVCVRDYCTEVDGMWVHDEYLDEYNTNEQGQLELDMESKEEAVVEVLAFVNSAVKELLPMSQCVEVRGTWVHKDFQNAYHTITERTLNEPNQLHTWYN